MQVRYRCKGGQSISESLLTLAIEIIGIPGVTTQPCAAEASSASNNNVFRSPLTPDAE